MCKFFLVEIVNVDEGFRVFMERWGLDRNWDGGGMKHLHPVHAR
jgi:hypothetical protein